MEKVKPARIPHIMIFFIVIVVVPLITVTCQQISNPVRQRKINKKLMREIVKELPVDGIYESFTSSGRTYIDKWNRAYTVKYPENCKINTSTFHGDMGIEFQFESFEKIYVISQKTTHDKADLNELVEELKSELYRKSLHSRRIIINGLDGIEVAGISYTYNFVHTIQYIEHGWQHTITCVCDRGSAKRSLDIFFEFLSSFRGLKHD
jgi:hypothetical protein